MLIIAQVARNGITLDCWLSGGKHFVVDPPFRPFFYDLLDYGRGEEVTRCLLSQPHIQKQIWKVSVRNVYEVRQQRLGASIECTVRFIERLAQEQGFKQDDELVNTLAFDIEASSKGQFPRADRDEVTALAVCSRSTQKVLVNSDLPEYEILAKSSEIIMRDNPDLIATYSGTAFDYDFPSARASILGVDWALGRMGDTPYTKTREYLSGKKKGVDRTTYLKGRICFDVYKEVRFDPYLSGIRRGLKDVGRFFFGSELVKELDRARLAQATGTELADYCFSDARLTYLLAEHYLKMLKPVAVQLKVPLDFMVYRSPSHIGNIVYGREFNKLGIVSDGANFERFTGVLWHE